MSQKPLNKWTRQEMPKLTLDKLESFLWKAADILPEEEPVNVAEFIVELRKLQAERLVLEEEFERNMRELGYE